MVVGHWRRRPGLFDFDHRFLFPFFLPYKKCVDMVWLFSEQVEYSINRLTKLNDSLFLILIIFVQLLQIILLLKFQESESHTSVGYVVTMLVIIPVLYVQSI